MQFVEGSAGCRLQRQHQGPSFALTSLALGSGFTQDDILLRFVRSDKTKGRRSNKQLDDSENVRCTLIEVSFRAQRGIYAFRALDKMHRCLASLGMTPPEGSKEVKAEESR